MTTEETTTPIHAFVRSDVVRSAFLSPLEASGWSIASLRDSTDLAALLRDAAYAVLVVDTSSAPPVPGPWVQGVFVGSGEAPEGLSARPFSTPIGQLAADLRRMAFVAQLAALRADRSHQARGFLEDVPLRSCLAALVGRKTSGTIRFEGKRGAGCIYLRDGLVIDVECSGLRGEEALARLLAWTEGSVHVAEGTVLGDAAITRPTDDVFAEAERMAATVAAALVLLPKPGVSLQLERFIAARIVPNPSEELERLLALVDGSRDIVALLDASPFDDASTARTLARFAQGGAIHAVGSASQAEDVPPPSVSLVARPATASLPQVTLEMDAPVIATNAVAPLEAAPVSSVGATTPVGLFAATVNQNELAPTSLAAVSRPVESAPAASADVALTPAVPGADTNDDASSAGVGEAPAMRRTPISVETPAKAALDAAFRKAAQESQAALAASDAPAPQARRSVPAPPVNDRAKRLVGGIAVAALVLFGFVGVKSLVPSEQPTKPAEAPAPTPSALAKPAEPAVPAPSVSEPAPSAEAAEGPVATDSLEAGAVEATSPSSPASPPAPTAPTAPAAPSVAPAAPAPAWASAPKLPPGRLQKAKDFLDRGQFVSASVEAQAVVQGDPTQAEAWLVLGAAALAQEKAAEAKHFFGECVRRGRGPAVAECRQFMSQ